SSLGALAVCSSFCRNGADGGWFRVLPPRSRKLAAGLGSPADDVRLHGAVDRGARGAVWSARGPGRLRASAPAGGRQRSVLVLERAPRPGRSAPVLPRAVRIALDHLAAGPVPSPNPFESPLPPRRARNVRAGQGSGSRGR